MEENFTVVRFSRDSSLAKIESLKYCETPDKICENVHNFGIFYVICIALSIITYIIDLGLACLLLYYYSIHNNGLYFAITLTFTLVPAILMTTVSLRWYIVDHDDPTLGRTSVTNWIIRIIVLLLQLAPLLRYVDTLILGIKSKIAGSTGNYTQQMTLYRRMLDEDTNSALLRLFHCFLHAAPQAVLQLMFFLMMIKQRGSSSWNEDIAILQIWTVLMALISIAWALTSYHRSVRYSRDDKHKLKFSANLVAFCWHLMSSFSRVLALSLLASIFPVWMGCVCAFHWCVMSIWLSIGQQQGAAYGNRCEELMLSVALGLAYVLAFISPKDGPTRYLYLAYYLVCFMENTGALVVWCVSNNTSENPLLYYGAAILQMFSFFLGIIFLCIYYTKCHPTVITRSKLPTVDLDKPGFSKSYNMRRSSS